MEIINAQPQKRFLRRSDYVFARSRCKKDDLGSVAGIEATLQRSLLLLLLLSQQRI